MEIKIQIKDRVYSLCIGRKTEWFEQTYLVSLTELIYGSEELDKEVIGGFFIFGWFKEEIK